MTAVCLHRTDCVRLLIDAGADMTIVNFVRVDFRLSIYTSQQCLFSTLVALIGVHDIFASL
jgi:hypothetical protein